MVWTAREGTDITKPANSPPLNLQYKIQYDREFALKTGSQTVSLI